MVIRLLMLSLLPLAVVHTSYSLFVTAEWNFFIITLPGSSAGATAHSFWVSRILFICGGSRKLHHRVPFEGVSGTVNNLL